MSICQLLLCFGAWRVLLLDPVYSAVMMAELNCAWPSVFLSPQLQQRDVCGWWKLVPLRVCSGFRWARLSHKWVLDDAWSSWLSALLMCNTSLQKQRWSEMHSLAIQLASPLGRMPTTQQAPSLHSAALMFTAPREELFSQWPKANQPGYPALITELVFLFENLSSGRTRHTSGFTVWCIQTCKWAHDVNVSWAQDDIVHQDRVFRQTCLNQNSHLTSLKWCILSS